MRRKKKPFIYYSRFQIQLSSPLRLEEEKQGKRLPEFSLLSARSLSLSQLLLVVDKIKHSFFFRGKI